MTDALNNTLFRQVGVSAKFSMSDVRQNTQAIIHQQQSMRNQFYQRNDVPLFHGHARFRSPNEIEVEGGPVIRAEKHSDRHGIATVSSSRS